MKLLRLGLTVVAYSERKACRHIRQHALAITILHLSDRRAAHGHGQRGYGLFDDLEAETSKNAPTDGEHGGWLLLRTSVFRTGSAYT